jgi:hypothetical protein
MPTLPLRLVGLLLVLVSVCCSVSIAAPRTVLLVDDHDVLYRAGTRRVLHPARRHENGPVIAEEKPWEVAIAWCSAYRDPISGKYQLWYQAYSGKAAKEKRNECVVCYAESDDGLKFTKPQFDLFPYNEVAKTNIVLVGNGGYGDRYGASVIVDPHESDAARRYKMVYYDWAYGDAQQEAAGLHIAYSPDGVHWTKQLKGPLLRTSYGGRGRQPPMAGEDPYLEAPYKGAVRKTWAIPLSMSDAMDLMYDGPRNRFVLYGKMWLQGPDGGLAWKHAMGRTESTDLARWSKPELVLTPDDRDPPELEFHTSPVFYYAGVYLGLNQILDRRAGGTMNIELMTSRDGLGWQRPFRDEWFMQRGTGREFDAGSIFTNATPIMLKDEIRFYYGAYGQGAVGGGSQIEGDEQQSGVGLATIPRDRFAGLTTVARSAQPTLKKPLEHVGQVTLKPRDFAAVESISINADADEGSIRAEILDEDGYRVAGFTRDEATPYVGDSLRQPLTWKKSRLADLPPGNYSLRLHLQKATVYAVTLE